MVLPDGRAVNVKSALKKRRFFGRGQEFLIPVALVDFMSEAQQTPR
jgi:hypothetical protein